MSIMIFIIACLSVAYLIDKKLNRTQEEFVPLLIGKEIELIGSFYVNPRVRISKGFKYEVLDETRGEKQLTSSSKIYLSWCLIKDDGGKLSWVAMSHFKVVE